MAILYPHCFSSFVLWHQDGPRKKKGLILKRTHQLLVYADDVNIGVENIDAIHKNTKPLLDASKEVGLEVNPEKTKYMLVSRRQKAIQRQSIKVINR
jgi:hypothetical protein